MKTKFNVWGIAPPILAICNGLKYKYLKIFYLIIIFTSVQSVCYSQIQCGSDFLNSQAPITNGINNSNGPSCPSIYSSFSIEIPVIVHVMYNNEFENISFEEVNNMIQNANNYLITEPIDGYNVNIQLKLAENGTCSPGYERVFLDDPNYYGSSPSGIPQEELRVKNSSLWPVDKYLNVWILNSVELDNPIAGFCWTELDFESQYKEDLIDGIVLDNDYLNYFIHEFGHWANLYHLNEGGYNGDNGCAAGPNWPAEDNCQYDDQVNDTRPLTSSSPPFFEDYTCEQWLNGMTWSYNPNIHINPWCYPIVNGGTEFFQYPVDNYMSYCDPCWTRFTPGQYIRMVKCFQSRRLSFLNNIDDYIEIVDLSADIIHSTTELLSKLGVNSFGEMCNSTKTYLIKLGGELILNPGQGNPICFGNNTTIKMLQNAKITVLNNSTATFDNVHIFACDEFWNRIYIESGSTLYVTGNSLIEDAQCAIEAEKEATLNLINSVFNNNYTGIKLNDLGTGSHTNISMSGCTIESDDRFSYLVSDLMAGRPQAGIIIDKQDYVLINSEDETTNTFNRLGNGILISEGGINIRNTVFTDIYPHFGNVGDYGDFFTRDGFAINIKSGGLTDILDCQISDARYGIGASDCWLKATSNEIWNVEQGILLKKMDDSRIISNDIEARERCLYNGFSKTPNYFNWHILDSNYFTISSNNESAKAVDIENCDGPLAENNRIYLNDNDAGFYCVNSQYNDAKDNTIIIRGQSSNVTDAAYVDESRNFHYINNHFIDLTSSNTNKGTYINNSLFGLYECNKVEDFSQGMHFIGNCDHSTLTTNIYNDNQIDLLLGISDLLNESNGETYLGDQFIDGNTGLGNTWPTSDNLAHNSATKDRVEWSIFKVKTQYNPNFKPETVEAEGEWFDDKTYYNNLPPCDEFYIGSTLFPKILHCTDFIAKIRSIDTMRNIDVCKKWAWKYKYFKELLIMKQKGLLTNECLQYLATQQNNILVKIANVQIASDKLHLIKSGDTVLVNNYLNLASALDGLYKSGNIYTQTWTRTAAQFDIVSYDFKIMLRDRRVEYNSRIDSIKNVINVTAVPDSCLKELLNVISVKLNLLKTDTLSVAERNYLTNIANICSDNSGEDVAIARSLLSLYENYRYPRIDECVDRYIRLRNAKSETSEGDKLQLYPNPAKETVNINIQLDKNESGNIFIADLLGNEIYHGTVDGSKNNILVETGNYSQGVYIVRYHGSNGDKYIEKFLIIK